MKIGYRMLLELLFSASLGLVYFALMIIAPKSGWLEPFWKENMIILYFSIPMIVSAVLLFYSKMKVYAIASFAVVLFLYTSGQMVISQL
ncbi:hypothetical protein [Bacillus sp. 165]|uniref:hypothetical protein n=1 Tax=Bacillus sp. 165 TaxID=1529117 RepID=UPI001ADAB44A|nr:hypothetical protein [Bacillus sp. 165]MBO9128126.1 hypothetical protein [Bacillus sp. 165]